MLKSIISSLISCDGNNGKNHETIVIKYLVQRIKTLEKSSKKVNERLRNCICFQTVHKNILKNDEKVMFYIDIPKLSTFLNLYDFISPFVERKCRGVKSTRKPSSKFIKSNLNQKERPACKLTRYDEFLITLMKIRLELLNEDIADRFKFSRTLISQIFSTWVRATVKVLSCMIKVWDLGTVSTLRAKKFKSQKLHSVADATEIFIQTPKDHLLQCLTWSNYKYHNTLKVLVIALSSDIMFISSAYQGSISDKKITKQSGYRDMMEPYTELVLDEFNSN